MPTYFTDQINDTDSDSNNTQLYNALDCLMTFEIQEHLHKVMNGDDLIYNFEKALQAPAMEMQLRGIRVDPSASNQLIRKLEADLICVENILEKFVTAIWDQPMRRNKVGRLTFPNSTPQLCNFFYNYMGLDEIRVHIKGEVKTPMDRETLEKLHLYFQARPIISAILCYRTIEGQLEVLKTEVDNDFRIRSSVNIAGTDTGRFSYSKSTTGSGRNMQNITENLRYIFIADKGKKIAGIDKEQAESREVGYFCGITFNDWSYLDAVESGDIHTYSSRLIWPNLPWTGDLKLDREIADTPFYRHFSYREITKRAGHGCLTEDHEILTPDGWVPITDKPAIIMQFSPVKSEFVAVSSWTDKSWTGDFHEWEGQSISVKMTAPHRVYYTTTDKDGIKISPASEVPFSAKIPNGWGYVGGKTEIAPQMARIIAAFQCDGSYRTNDKIRFHFHKIRKFMRLESLAIEAGLEFLKTNDYATVAIENANSLPKKAGAYLLTWPAESLRAYLEELPHWDGHFATTSVYLSSVDREHLDWIRTCNRVIGIGGNIQKPKVSGFGSTTYVLQYNNRQYASLSSATRTVKNETLRVLCPSVPSKAFYIRRKEKISITGNTNYFGKPYTIARELRVPDKMIREFQERYFSAFPCIPDMHQWVAQEIQTKKYLINVFGRRRDFFSRPESDDTLRAAIAYLFQSATADDMNLGLWRLWRYMSPRIELLLQLHDAVYFQYSLDDNEEEVLREANRLLEVKLTAPNGREFIVPTETKVGFNLGSKKEIKNKQGNLIKIVNPRGLEKVRI